MNKIMNKIFLLNISISIFCTQIIAQSNDRSLIAAAAMSEIDQVRNLINEDRVNVNMQDNYGKTALHYACICCENKNYDIINLLLSFNIDTNIEDESGKTALDIALELKKLDVVDFILQCNPKNLDYVKYSRNLLIQTIKISKDIEILQEKLKNSQDELKGAEICLNVAKLKNQDKGKNKIQKNEAISSLSLTDVNNQNLEEIKNKEYKLGQLAAFKLVIEEKNKAYELGLQKGKNITDEDINRIKDKAYEKGKTDGFDNRNEEIKQAKLDEYNRSKADSESNLAKEKKEQYNKGKEEANKSKASETQKEKTKSYNEGRAQGKKDRDDEINGLAKNVSELKKMVNSRERWIKKGTSSDMKRYCNHNFKDANGKKY